MAIATNPDPQLMRWFLDNGADPNAACQINITPLSTAAARAPLAIVKQLLAHCPADTSFRGQLLHYAARRQDHEGRAVLQHILDRCQPDVNKQMFRDCPLAYECYKVTGLGTALHEAARTGQPSVALALLEKGADVSIKDSRGHTALEVAELAGNEPVRELLTRVEAKQLNVRGAKI